MLHHGGVLLKPLLYLSLYFKQHRPEYYRLLDVVRTEGDWEAWLDFFLEGVEDTASNAVRTAQSLVHLFNEDAVRVQAVGRSASTPLRVFNALCARPITTINDTASEQVSRSPPQPKESKNWPSWESSKNALAVAGTVFSPTTAIWCC